MGQFDSRKREIVRNLLRLYRKSSQADVTEGLGWYPLAQGIVRQWAGHYRLSVDTVACVTAAVSPQLDWSRNLIIADDILAGRMPSIGGALPTNVRKAEVLRDTDYRSEDRAHWNLDLRMAAVFPQGPKVASFAANLAGDLSVVTVDTHCAQAALEDPLVTVYLKWKPYTVFAECYATAAGTVGLQGAEFQAIIWHTWRRLYPKSWKQKNRQQWHAMGEC